MAPEPGKRTLSSPGSPALCPLGKEAGPGSNSTGVGARPMRNVSPPTPVGNHRPKLSSDVTDQERTAATNSRTTSRLASTTSKVSGSSRIGLTCSGSSGWTPVAATTASGNFDG